MGQQCTKQAKRPNFMELIFYTRGKLLSISSKVLLSPDFSCSCSWKACASQIGPVLPLDHDFSASTGQSMLWAPKCASRLPWRGHAFPHQPSSSYLFLIGFFFFGFSQNHVFSFCWCGIKNCPQCGTGWYDSLCVPTENEIIKRTFKSALYIQIHKIRYVSELNY